MNPDTYISPFVLHYPQVGLQRCYRDASWYEFISLSYGHPLFSAFLSFDCKLVCCLMGWESKSSNIVGIGNILRGLLYILMMSGQKIEPEKSSDKHTRNLLHSFKPPMIGTHVAQEIASRHSNEDSRDKIGIKEQSQDSESISLQLQSYMNTSRL